MISSSQLSCVAALIFISTPGVSSARQHADASTAPPSVLSTEDLTQPTFEPGAITGLQWPDAIGKRRPAAPIGAGAQPAGPAGGEDLTSQGFSISDTMTGPLITEPSDGRIWVRTRDFRASYGSEGFTVLPIFGLQSPQEWPVRFSVDGARCGADELDLAPGSPRLVGESVETSFGVMREVHHLRVDEIEQTFVFDELPGAGDLEVRLDVDTELTPRFEGGRLRFEHPEFGHVSYGKAFVVDAKGATLDIERRWTGDGISLTVPSAYLEHAALPFTIDPVITAFSSNFGASDDSFPDVCYAGFAQQYCVVWQEYTSATNADVYGTTFNTAGAQGAGYAIEITSDYWRDPRVAYIPAGGRLLVVATHNVNGPGTGTESIKGQLVQVNGNTLIGSDFYISSVGQNKASPVVGGTNYLNVTNNHFMVAWSRQTSVNAARIEARIINWDGAAVTGLITIDSPVAEFSIQPAISASHGDADLSGDLWTLAWIQDSTGNGRGRVAARRVPWNGNLNSVPGTTLVTFARRASHPTATSRHDEFLPGTTDRPSIVAWQERVITGLNVHHDILASVIYEGQSSAPVQVTHDLEDLNSRRDQIRPSIATDGKCFVLTYAENSPTGGTGNYDMYMMSGNVAKFVSANALALSERHQVMSSSTNSELYGRVAMIQDGDNASASDRGAAIWVRTTASGPDRGRLYGATVDCGTSGVGTQRAMGVQYCDAAPNSVGVGQNDETSSWLRIHGSYTVSNTAKLRCVDMQPNQFGYFLCSLTPGDVVMAGGSSGRLCLGGSVGRFDASVLNSGPDGTVELTVLPHSLPQPNGVVSAQPGETWYFQYWHRDTNVGGLTSNFSNGCSVTFQP